jgi:hypothetical protein
MVLTTADRLVLPHKQRALAAALGATTFELDADHDAPIANVDAFASPLKTAVDHVAHRTGASPPTS